MATFQQFLAAQGLAMGGASVGQGGGFLTWAFTDAITAHAGGGQAGAYQLTTQLNNVTTVASAGDSVKLPTPSITAIAPAGPQDNRGNMVLIINSGANTLAVFPDSGGTINGGSANASVSVAAGDIVGFYQTSALTWFTADNANKIFGNVTLKSGAFLYESAATAITAGTTRTQGGATVLANEINRIDTSSAPSAGSILGDGVVLPAAAAGLSVLVWNNTANPVQLYANGSDTINGVAGSTGVVMAPNSVALTISAAPGSWIVDGTAIGNAGAYSTEVAVNGITAHAGGGQGSAVLLPAMMNRVTTVGTAADSVILPTSAAGMQITVTNAAASNSMNVFPASGEAINALGANTAFAVAAGKTATFYCFNNGQWHALLSA